MCGTKTNGRINIMMFSTFAQKLFIFLLNFYTALLFKEQRPAKEEIQVAERGPPAQPTPIDSMGRLLYFAATQAVWPNRAGYLVQCSTV